LGLRSRILRYSPLLAAVLAAPRAAAEDTIVRRDGQRIGGVIVAEDERKVGVQTRRGRITAKYEIGPPRRVRRPIRARVLIDVASLVSAALRSSDIRALGLAGRVREEWVGLAREYQAAYNTEAEGRTLRDE